MSAPAPSNGVRADGSDVSQLGGNDGRESPLP
jgi:hypothetical protein